MAGARIPGVVKPRHLNAKRRQVQQTYDMLLASGPVLEEITTGTYLKQKRHGGVVPPKRLVELVGPRVAVTLIKERGGCYLPTHRALHVYLRDECIIRDYERGVTNLATLRAKYRCSLDVVYIATREAKKRMRERTAERLAQAGPAEAFVHRIKLGD